MQRIELALRHSLIKPPELDGYVVEPARRESPIEMPQPRHDDAGDRRADIGPRLIEGEKVEPFALGQVHTSHHLFACVEKAEFRIEIDLRGRTAVRQQVGMIRQPPWAGAVLAERALVAHTHEPDRQKLIELGERPQQRDPRIEMRAGSELDEILSVLRRMGHGDKTWNAEIVG